MMQWKAVLLVTYSLLTGLAPLPRLAAASASGGLPTPSDKAAATFCGARHCRIDNPHERINPKSLLWLPASHFNGQGLPTERPEAAPGRRLRGKPAKLWSSRQEVGGSDNIHEVDVHWSDVDYPRYGDWIGMFPAKANLTLFCAPLKFKKLEQSACKAHRSKTACVNARADSTGARCIWMTKDDHPRCLSGSPGKNGSVSFTVPNLRTDVYFVYLSGNQQYPEWIAASNNVKVLSPNAPRGVHVALGHQPGQVRVYWQAGGEPSKPQVWLRRASSDERVQVDAIARPGRQYAITDMCDRDTQPAGRQGWLSPGTLLEALLEDLEPGAEYSYLVGDEVTGWTREWQFTAPGMTGPEQETVIAAFGDMGQAQPDGAGQHSWDFNDQGEVPSRNTSNRLHMDEALELALHIGDISYAVGYMSEWDNFLLQIEPFAARKPWMTAIGNHEQGALNSFYTGSDSGGECGVPYNAHFPFASQDTLSRTPFQEREPWYVFSYGSGTFVQMSTEHNFTKGSKQHAWIRKALAAVNRTKTPWLVFSGHRPMYVGSEFAIDKETSDLLIESVEPMLTEFKVDIALWGHYHAYQRFCPARGGVCADDGVQHFLIGMAGYDHSPCPDPLPSLVSVCDDERWGYLRMKFHGGKSVTTEYVDGATGAIVDSFEIHSQKRRDQVQLV